jgi:hypothetical protein
MLNRGRARLSIFGDELSNAENSSELIIRVNDAYKSLMEIHRMMNLFNVFKVTGSHVTYLMPIKSAEIPHDDQLYIRSVNFRSPGFWEFLGKINPLEVIRLYLNDRHERTKDKKYRNDLEEEKLGIENKIYKLEFIQKFIETAEKAGLSKEEIMAIVRDKALIPLARLEVFQDKNMMTKFMIEKHDESE